MKIVGVTAASSENGQKVYRAGFVIYDSTRNQFTCNTPEELWSTLQKIVDQPVEAEKVVTTIRKGRTTKQQEEDLRKIGQHLVSEVPMAGPVLNVAGDLLGRMASLGRKRKFR